MMEIGSKGPHLEQIYRIFLVKREAVNQMLPEVRLKIPVFRKITYGKPLETYGLDGVGVVTQVR